MKSIQLATTIFCGLILALPPKTYGESAPQPSVAEKVIVTADPTHGNISPRATEQGSDLKSEEEKVNYAIGVQLIGNFKRQGIDIDLDQVVRGMRDALAGGPLLLDDGTMRRLIMTYQEKAINNLAKTRRAEAESNKQQGFSYLEENKKKEGVITLDSGLQLSRSKTGNGPMPTQADTVEYTYRGTLIDGTVFDQSPEDGKPVRVKLSSMLPGVQEALKLMPVGSAWKIVIPAHLGYGPRGNGNTVGPHSVLVYEIELHGVRQE